MLDFVIAKISKKITIAKIVNTMFISSVLPSIEMVAVFACLLKIPKAEQIAANLQILMVKYVEGSRR